MGISTGATPELIALQLNGTKIDAATKPDTATVTAWIAQAEAMVGALFFAKDVSSGADAVLIARRYVEADVSYRIVRSQQGQNVDTGSLALLIEDRDRIYRQIRDWPAAAGASASTTLGDAAVSGVVTGTSSARTLDGGL